MARSTLGSAVRAADKVSRSSLGILKTTAENEVKAQDFNDAALQARSAEKEVAMELNKRGKIAEMKAQQKIDLTEMKVDEFKNRQSAGKSKRKAGIVAGIGMIASDIITENKLGDAPKRERQDFSSIDSFMASQKAKIDAARAKENSSPLETSSPSPSPSSSNTSNSVNTAALNSSAAPGTLSGTKKEFADAIAGPESGSWGYEAFNQGGAAGGTKVLGKSGSYKETYGRSLTDMTLGEIYHKQNTKQRGLSLDEHFKSGGLHAVGRYQFIGSTLQDEAKRMGLSPDTKFTPEVQDSIFFSHAKRVGNISPWVGPSVKYDPAERARLNNMISTF